MSEITTLCKKADQVTHCNDKTADPLEYVAGTRRAKRSWSCIMHLTNHMTKANKQYPNRLLLSELYVWEKANH